MPCIGCPTSSPPRPAERASLSERRLGRVGDHLGEDPRKDRCPPPKCFLLPMPRAPGASSDPEVPGAGVLSGAPQHSALLHPSPLQGPNLGSGAVIWEKSLRYKFALSPRCQGKGGFFKLFYSFIYFIFSCAGSSLPRGLSLVAASGGYSWLLSTGFSPQRLLLLLSTDSRAWGSVVAALAPQCVESSWTRDRTCLPCVSGRILNHWTTRKFPEKEVYKPAFLRLWSFRGSVSGEPLGSARYTVVIMGTSVLRVHGVRRSSQVIAWPESDCLLNPREAARAGFPI